MTLFAAGGIGGPVFGGVELSIQWRVAFGGGVRQEDAPLTVLLLAQATAPLPPNAAGVGPGLGIGTGVEDQDGLAVGQLVAGMGARNSAMTASSSHRPASTRNWMGLR